MEALRERFGKYHVLEKIAQGGMAEVYKVKTVGIAGFEKIQALKRILPHSAREGRFIRSFIDEARIAVELTHRNIVQVFDFGKADGELFLAMELIEGKDLRTALNDGVARDLMPTPEIAAYIVAEVAAGLDYAHRKTDVYGSSLNIVHCDVSPSNVMLSDDGYVKILDFGIARATFAAALERRRLRGKPRYMAPEQTFGEPPTPASDVFALGIIAWELFTGLPLYRGPDLRSILELVRHTDAPRIDQINPRVPAEIVDAVAAALHREPGARGTAADLHAACARTAMMAGARQLAGWLAELELRPSTVAIDRPPEVTSLSVPEPGPREATWRPSARSITRSLASAAIPDLMSAPGAIVAGRPGAGTPPGGLGAGTPDFPDDPDADELPTTRAPRIELDPRADEAEIPTATTAPAQRRRAEPAEPAPWREAPGDAAPHRILEQTLSLHEPLPAILTAPVPTRAPAPARAPTPVSAPVPAHVPPPPPAAVLTEPYLRPSITSLIPPLALVEDTSYDELDVEPSVDSAADAARAPELDEPIDDDLGAMAAGLPAERRRTVIVAATLAGAPPDVLRTLTRSLGELAYQRGGVALELEDDSLVIAFGLEVAGEDDTAVAMGWALDAAAMARDAAGGAGAGPALRIGARTSVQVQVGPDGTPGLPPDALEEVKALAREAAPERPMFVGGAGRLTSSLYELREVPAPRRVARRSRVLEVVGPRSFDERDRARLERRGTFIGRAAQLAELEAAFARAIALDRRLTVMVLGAAGTGKSRLVAELIARLRARPPEIRVITCAASPASHLTPFALLIDLYQAALRLPPARGRGARAQVLRRLMRVLLEAGVATERAKAITIDLDRAMELRDGEAVGAREAADLRPRLAAGLSRFRSVGVDRERPLVTVIEDVHLADSASLEVLRHHLGMPASAPEILVMTARPEELAPAGPLPADLCVPLSDLVGGELRALIADRLGDAASPLNIAAVLSRGGGNPMFVEELALAVRDAGKSGEAVPASARDVVSARIDRLAPKARAALRFAAVLGGGVRARLLAELLGEGSLEPELDELVRAGFLVRPETAAGSAEGELVFARGLVREVVYDALSARQQREGHARVGRLLASRFFAGREEPPALIADHLERGGEATGAAAFWLRAGRLALTASDAASAAASFTRTLSLEHDLGSAPPTPTSRARRREALAGREEAHRLMGDLATDAGDLDELERLSGDEPARLADVALRRAQRSLRLGDYAAARAATDAAEERATVAGDDRLRGEALRVRGEILERLGRFDEALEAVTAARERFRRLRLVTEEMGALVGRGRIHLMRARYESARDSYRPVLAFIEQSGDPWLERIATNHLAIVDLCLGNYQRAMDAAERSLELCRRHGDRAREGDGLAVTGAILLEVGLLDAAAATFDEALAILLRTSSRWSRADCLIYAGVCELRRARPGGLPMLDEALAEARRLGARYIEANALISRAEANLRRGAIHAALDDAAEGTAVARDATLVGYEIKGLARHALALVRLGAQGGEAPRLVERALGLFESQRHLEGSEEEVLLACAEVLRAAGAAERAREIVEQARASAYRKLDALTDPTWRAAFLGSPHIRELLG
ncbi:MAG TPA: protein kinase [Kofleriaceae bacterium]|nr:protein kinase [Kofleriaceae bacterium]